MEPQEDCLTCPFDCPVKTSLEQQLIELEATKIQTKSAGRAYYVDKGFTYINVAICLLFYFAAAFDYQR
ncbi:MAG TPA: hypothetical protein VIQ31_29065, partial [Phormidium sp.]